MSNRSGRTGGQDTTKKSCHWIVTAHGDDDREKLKDETKYPVFVREVAGGDEIGGKTEKLHGQYYIHTASIRFSQLKNWLTTSHIEICIDKDASKKYCMKSETAVGEKTAKANPKPYLSFEDLCMHIAYFGVPEIMRKKMYEQYETNTYVGEIVESMYWRGVNNIILSRPDLASSLSKFNVKFWLATAETWLQHCCDPGWLPRLVLPEEADNESTSSSVSVIDHI